MDTGDNYIFTSLCTVDSEGRIEIPENVRNALGIKEYGKVRIIATDKGIVIDPINEISYLNITKKRQI